MRKVLLRSWVCASLALGRQRVAALLCALALVGVARAAEAPPGGGAVVQRPASERVIRMATTTSTENSGLLGWLLPPFE
jgi:hypothetical protein